MSVLAGCSLGAASRLTQQNRCPDPPSPTTPPELLLPPEDADWARSAVHTPSLPDAEAAATTTYFGPFGGEFFVHISRWPLIRVYEAKQRFRAGNPHLFDMFLSRGQFLFGIQTDDSLRQATILLARSPALSRDCVHEHAEWRANRNTPPT